LKHRGTEETEVNLLRLIILEQSDSWCKIANEIVARSCVSPLFLRYLRSSVFQRFWRSSQTERHPGGVFLTVITTSHTPFSMKSSTAGKKYLPTGTRWKTHHTTPATISKSIAM
jgi:hypothetical protein